MKTEINIYIIFAILIIHWFTDFILQTDEQAKNKSKSWKALLSHTGLYSFYWLAFASWYGIATDNYLRMLLFAPITFIFHTITDYYTSKVNSQLYNEGKIHQFFISIGFDQILHYIQLFLTYLILSK